MINVNFQKKYLFFITIIIILSFIDNKLSGNVFARESVLLIRPMGKNYSKIERGFEKEVGNLFNIEKLTTKFKIGSDIVQIESQKNPRAVILIGIEALKVYQEYYKSSASGKRPTIVLLPKILSSNNSFGLINNKNSVIIQYYVSVAASVEKLEEKLHKNVKNIGIVYHIKMKNEINLNRTYSHKKNVYTQSYEVAGSGITLKNDLKKRLDDIIAKKVIDIIWIPNDPQLTTPELVNNLWKPFFEKTKIISIVLNESLLASKGGFGTMYIRPDFNEIGRQTGDLVKDIIINNIPAAKLTTDNNRFFYSSLGLSQLPASAEKTPDTTETIAAIKEENKLLDTSIKTVEDGDLDVGTKEKSHDDTDTYAFSDTDKKKLLVALSNENKNIKNNAASDNITTPGNKKNSQETAIKTDTITKSTLNSDTDKKQEKEEDSTLQGSGIDSLKLAIEDNIESYKEVNSNNVKILNKLQSQVSQFFTNISSSLKYILFIVAVAALLIGLLFIVIPLLGKKNSTKSPSEKSCLIVSRNLDKIPYSDKKDFSITLHKFFKKLKFEVTVAKDLKTVKETLMHYIPKVVCVDWQFEVDIRSDIQKLLPDISLLSDVIIIFYNAIDSFHFENEAKFARTFYFGTSFTLKEIQEVINSSLNGKKKTTDDTNKDNYLAGKISNYNLVEIFQLLGSEKKTGCLVIECDVPVGLIFFNNSRIIYAITNDLKGKDAVFRILKLTEGMFRFIPDKKPISTNMDHDIFHVLMEWTASMDKETQERSSPQKK